MEPKIEQDDDFISFVEKVTDTADVTAYRVRAGKWPRVRYSARPTDYPDPATPDLHPYNVWPHGAATLHLELYESEEPTDCGRVTFFDAAPAGEWFVSTRKRCVWAILLKRVPPPFTGHE